MEARERDSLSDDTTSEAIEKGTVLGSGRERIGTHRLRKRKT
jgi:hypothetical protein